MAEDIFETEEEEEEEAAAVVTAQPTDYEFSQTFLSVGLQGSISMNLPASSNDVSNSLGRGSGVGRGSHLVRPAWMTPN